MFTQQDAQFEESWNDSERSTWNSFKLLKNNVETLSGQREHYTRKIERKAFEDRILYI